MNDLEIQLSEVMQSDRHRLRRQYAQIARLPNGHPRKQADLERWQHAVKQSSAKLRDRRQLRPTLTYDPDLPITTHRESLIRLIQDRQTIVVCGETGSGKSTQLPKLCLEAGRGRSAMIGHTQPRRLAARSIASRLAEELETQVGQQVGFKIRFTDRTMPMTLVKLMTDGVLLAEIQRDQMLDAYDTIIIDEAHERSLNIDLLMAYIHQLLPKRPELRLIITSATIDAERFSEHFHDVFGPAPIVTVSGRTYPVDIRYRGADQAQEDGSDTFWMQRFTQAVDELSLAGFGDILAFLPTERHIRDMTKQLRGHLTQQGLQDRLEILPLYSRLTEAEQQRIFQPHRTRRIVLATNVAESSLTVPGIRFVIDTGTARISRYAPRSKVQRLPIEAISQASADQRAGRCGRLGPGICIRLFSQQDYAGRPRFTTPEIRRTNLASAILQSQILGVGDLAALPLLDPPRPEMINDGLATLRELNAIDAQNSLTDLGRRLGRWPVDPRVGRMIIEADRNGCLADVLIIAAALEIQDPRLRPPEKQSAADAAHAKFLDPHSDFLGLLRIWDFYHRLKEELGRGRLQRACNENFLSLPRLREWSDVHRQLSTLVAEQGMKIGNRKLVLGVVSPRPDATAPPGQLERSGKGKGVDRQRLGVDSGPRTSKLNAGNIRQPQKNQRGERKQPRNWQAASGEATSRSRLAVGVLSDEEIGQRPAPAPWPAHFEQIHLSLLAGLLSGIALLDDRKYKGAGGIDFQLWPGSGLKGTRPKWIMTAEIVETHVRFGRTIAMIDQNWIEPLAAHLMKYSYDEPHYSEKTGSAMVYQRGTLFGIPVIQRRRVALAPIDPALSRKFLIDEGLVEKKLRSRAAFYLHNNRLLEEVHEWANRTRRRDLVVDPYFLIQFYEQNLPASIVDRSTLEQFDRAQSKLEPGADPSSVGARAAWLTWDQIASALDQASIQQQFPDTLPVGQVQLPLIYRFAPGDDLDGVSLLVPEVAVSQLHNEQLEWLVPGLLEAKILALIKSLPKHLRRNLVPAPEVAAKATRLVSASQAAGKAFWPAICECLGRLAEERIHPTDFQLDKVPEHFRMIISVVDAAGNVKANSRKLAELQNSETVNSPPSVAQPLNIQRQAWFRDSMKTFEAEEIPEQTIVQHGSLQVTMYPTIISEGDRFKTHAVDNLAAAERSLEESVLAMYVLSENRELKSQVNHLPGLSKAQLQLASRVSSNELRSDLGALMMRVAFLEGLPRIRTRTEFEARRTNRIERIMLAAQDIGQWLPRFSDQYHKVSIQLEQAPLNWKANIDDIRQQLDALMPANFMKQTPWEWLREYPRYLHAIALRLDRLKTIGSAKDMVLVQSIMPFSREAQRRIAEAGDSRKSKRLAEFRWAVEELRVSIFAQQLGTRIPISPKRLEKILAELDTPV